MGIYVTVCVHVIVQSHKVCLIVCMYHCESVTHIDHFLGLSNWKDALNAGMISGCLSRPTSEGHFGTHPAQKQGRSHQELVRVSVVFL